jgi:hypothetical protein
MQPAVLIYFTPMLSGRRNRFGNIFPKSTFPMTFPDANSYALTAQEAEQDIGEGWTRFVQM